MLLLHGGMAHARWWDFVAPLLACGTAVYALDRRGHGDSEWTDPERYGWERDLRDVEAAMHELAHRAWVVVGHSQGGLLGVHLATRGNARVVGLVLVDVPLHPTSPRLMRAGRAFHRIPQLRYPSLDDAVRRFQPFPTPHLIRADRLRYLARHSFRPTGDGGFTSKFHWKTYQRERTREGSPLADFAERVRAIDVPVLSLRGESSSILSRAEHEELIGCLARGRGVEIADATHSLHAEQPEAVAREVDGFVASL